MNFENWFLDLKEIEKLSEIDKNRVHQYYDMMFMYEHDKRMKPAMSFFRTLERAGYIKNYLEITRGEKISDLVDEV